MALTDIPSIQTIKDRIISDIEGKISQTVPAMVLSFIRVLSGALADVFNLLYHSVSFVYKQIFTKTQAEDSLRTDGENIGVVYQTSSYAIISATVTGAAGFINSGTTFFGDNNVVYRAGTTTAIPGSVQFTALSSGTKGNLSVGDIINISVSATGIDPTATVTAIDSPAEDDENIEDYRERVSIRKKTKVFYGSPAGYALSGLEAPSVIWAGPYADPTLPGTVNVYIRMDLTLGTDGIPTAPQLAIVENFLRYENGTGLEIRRPINDTLNVLAITNNQFDITVSVQNVNLTLKNSIEAAIRTKVQTYEPYVNGVSTVRNDTMTVTDLAGIGDAIASVEGGKVVTVSIVDVLTTSFTEAYTFYGGVFGIVRSVSFVDLA